MGMYWGSFPTLIPKTCAIRAHPPRATASKIPKTPGSPAPVFGSVPAPIVPPPKLAHHPESCPGKRLASLEKETAAPSSKEKRKLCVKKLCSKRKKKALMFKAKKEAFLLKRKENFFLLKGSASTPRPKRQEGFPPKRKKQAPLPKRGQESFFPGSKKEAPPSRQKRNPLTF